MKGSGPGATIEEIDNRPDVGSIVTGDDVGALDRAVGESGAPAVIAQAVAIGSDLRLAAGHTLKAAVLGDDCRAAVGIAQIPGSVELPDGLRGDVHGVSVSVGSPGCGVSCTMARRAPSRPTTVVVWPVPTTSSIRQIAPAPNSRVSPSPACTIISRPDRQKAPCRRGEGCCAPPQPTGRTR